MLERINRAYMFMDKAIKKLGRTINIMEVCGAHTFVTLRCGIRSAFPPGLKLLPGPICPMCATAGSYIDAIIDLAQRQDCIIAAYADMIRLPGKDGSLESKTDLANMKIVSSSAEALALAKENPSKTIVFTAMGFENAVLATAMTIKEAAEQKIGNFCILCAHKLIIPAMMALRSSKNKNIDAFLCPGDISITIGSDAYKPLIEQFSTPCVIAGFEPMNIIQAIGEVCRQISEQKTGQISIYADGVNLKGDEVAQRIISEYFDVTDGLWRGVGDVSGCSLRLKGQYSQFDASYRFGLEEKESHQITGCRCNEVLCGLTTPLQCPLFETKCTPDTPEGSCMASFRGVCAAWYKYGRKR